MWRGYLVIFLGLALIAGAELGSTIIHNPPQEPATYYASNPTELGESIAVAKGGDTIIVSGEWDTSLKLAKLIYPDGEPLTVQGDETAVLHKGVAVMDCHNVVVSDFYIDGDTGSGGAEFNDSYPDIGVKNVTFKRLRVVPYAGPRGIFAGGHNMSGMKIIDCLIVGPIGDTHGIYLSGGIWNSAYGPISDTVIRGCTIQLQPGARNGIQINGRYKGGKIVNNLIRHAHLNAISFMGCQDFEIGNNVGYGCERGTFFVLYDYAGGWGQYYNYFQTQEDIDAFNASHHPCQRLYIHHNTMVVGPKAFCNWPGNNEDPTLGHPVVLLNNNVNDGFLMWVPDPTNPNGGEYVNHPGWDYPTEDLWFDKNIFWSPNLEMIKCYHEHEAAACTVTDNMFWSTAEGQPTITFANKLKVLSGNQILDPGFSPPIYDYVDTVTQPDYDWLTFKTSFNAFSMPGYRLGIGKKFPFPVLGQGDKVEDALRMMEYADPIEK